jgi:WD40 repeat protein
LRAQTFVDGETNAQEPAGLSVVWRVNGRKLHAAISTWAIEAFSPDGELVAVGDETGVRVRRTDDGSLVDMFWPGFADPFVYSLAVSSRGEVAIGRVGNVELHRPGAKREVIPYECADDCGPVGAVAFSPDGELLAFQGKRSLANRRLGLGSVTVVDVRTGTVRAELEASAARARVAFSRDGKRLFAASTTPIDDNEWFGLRVWNIADWTLDRRVLGASRAAWSQGALDGTPFAAAYPRDGSVEISDLETGDLLWSAGLIGPALEREGDGYATELDRVEIAPSGEFVISYETPVVDARGRAAVGAIVIRRALDGAVAAMYDVPNVAAFAIAPDGKSFVYTTGSGQTYTALARVGL